ncbi:hypothetical protein VCB98_06795 [Gammaproteobacteria bacterium AB-CW1]|uniref:Uncharacterized protein n=1 Tax=Natronospira elongata TaxID=3110268 RepID=A0AAP6JFE8_9GAMM|nr:hypothetical protein [Gammaproteobacteria bacterium AB-CW1]
MNKQERGPGSNEADELLERNLQRFDQALSRLDAARDFAKANYQTQILDLAARIMKLPGGIPRLYERAPGFQSAGLFYGTDWHYPERLLPELVTGSLGGPLRTLALEALSELRMLALAREDCEYEGISAALARRFLERVLAMNIRLVFPDHSEAAREQSDTQRHIAQSLMGFLLDHLGDGGVLHRLVDESEKILRQRPIDVSPVWRMLERLESRLDDMEDKTDQQRAARMVRAWRGPTELSAQSPETAVASYDALGQEEQLAELDRLGTSIAATGLVCPSHAALLQHLADASQEELSMLLALDGVGRDSLDTYEALCRTLIREAIGPETAQAVYGLHCLLNRGILFFPPIAPALWRLTRFQPAEAVSQRLHRESGAPDHLSGHSLLLAGTISVLGQPIGLGQGNNPTCQSARAISLWAQCDPGYLLELIMWAARDDEIDMHFEGALIRSSELSEGLIEDFHTELDMVSLLMVPHLDKIYWEMGRRIMGRGEDGHRWINPEFHGWWVNRGFASCIQYSTGAVVDFRGFIRRFYTGYHPMHNDGAELIYPQPAGVVATDSFGHFIGWHAISIQRVMLDPQGEMRVYFFNPNNESRQDWGQGVITSTEGHGEIPGESSLPFEQFASRLYVYHYNERELGDPELVPEDALDRIAEMARASWGADKAWHDLVPAD